MTPAARGPARNPCAIRAETACAPVETDRRKAGNRAAPRDIGTGRSL